MDPFRLNPALDAPLFAERFATDGRVHIPGFLAPEAAESLFQEIKQSSDWRLIINQGDQLFELGREAQAALTDEKRAQLDLAVYQSARAGFQYRYETIRVPDGQAERKRAPSLLNRFAEFLSSDEAIAFLREVTNLNAVDFADAQATAYGPGHFLTAHDDAVEGKNRHAAYVFNLTRDWHIDWGGLLTFHGPDGHVQQAFGPKFNALNIFRVPQVHSVSYVAPYVPYRRYAVTGWLRGRSSEER